MKTMRIIKTRASVFRKFRIQIVKVPRWGHVYEYRAIPISNTAIRLTKHKHRFCKIYDPTYSISLIYSRQEAQYRIIDLHKPLRLRTYHD